jgi:hypothetical protein
MSIEPDKRLETYEAIFGFILRVVTSIFGMALIGFVATLHGDVVVRVMLVFAGIAAMGPVIGATFASIVTAYRGKR